MKKPFFVSKQISLFWFLIWGFLAMLHAQVSFFGKLFSTILTAKNNEFVSCCNMGPDLELQGKSKAAMDFSVSKDNSIAPEGSEGKLLQCASNCEDNTFGMEELLVERAVEHDGIENMELNITDIIDTIDTVPVGECQAVTEHSSSFGGTESRIESGLMLTDDEIESHVCSSNASVYDGCFDAFQIRKKRLTVHWRKFIRPLMWRCKWIELQIKEL